MQISTQKHRKSDDNEIVKASKQSRLKNNMAINWRNLLQMNAVNKLNEIKKRYWKRI